MWPSSFDLSHSPAIFQWQHTIALLFCGPCETPSLWTNVTPQRQQTHTTALILLHWSDFLLFLTFHIQKTNATFSIHYATLALRPMMEGEGFHFQCIAGKWVIPHGPKCWWGSSCCILWTRELWNILKGEYCGQGGVPDDLMQHEGKRQKKYTMVHSVRSSYSVLYRLLLIFKETCEVIATHRFGPDIVTTLSVDDVLLWARRWITFRHFFWESGDNRKKSFCFIDVK